MPRSSSSSLRLRDARLRDTAIARQAREQGLVVKALSAHAVQGETQWNGLMLGYAQVPAERMDALVKRLAAVVHLAAYAADADDADVAADGRSRARKP